LERGIFNHIFNVQSLQLFLETKRNATEVAEVLQKIETTSESIGLVGKKAQALIQTKLDAFVF
jgi:hypothetical protein